ncbi:hypothetical protein AB0K09_30695 [Streptomyces sp. NPDC049577]|uniref:hypothetical protein n=1 Tax=Streptomyces sp. NPDC049577 TaxID=3155153 RepID=UPI00343F94B2
MDTPRRTILRGLAAAPFIAGAGGLLLPPTATAAARRRLTVRTNAPGSGFLTYRDVIRQLDARAMTPDHRWGIARAPLDVILAGSPQRRGVVERLTWPAGSPPAGETPPLHTVFRWQDDDYGTKDWRPQGITTNYDSLGGSPARTVLLVSWDAHPVRAEKQGTRVSIVDVPAGGAPRYWHVLLVEPEIKHGQPSFKKVELHAGGLAWYRNLLYVAEFHDSAPNGIRVFDLNHLFSVPATKDVFGYNPGDRKYYARRYGYVLPQVARYRDTAGDFRYSQLALERAGDGSVARDSLVVSEYQGPKSSRTPHIARWELAADGGLASLTSRETLDIEGTATGIQGAVGVRGTYYLSMSAGPTGNGHLRTWRPGWGAPKPLWRTPPGPEDLSYDRRGNVLWSLGEYAPGDQPRRKDGKRDPKSVYFTRHVYAMRLPS